MTVGPPTKNRIPVSKASPGKHWTPDPRCLALNPFLFSTSQGPRPCEEPQKLGPQSSASHGGPLDLDLGFGFRI